MAAVIYPLEADEGRDNSLGFTWRDPNGNRVAIEGYGAICEVRTPSGELVARITHDDGISLGLDDSDLETPDEESFQGDIIFTIPAKALTKPASYKCEYELILFPDPAVPRDKPFGLLRGSFDIRKQVVNLE